MRINKAAVENFASYKSLSFDFTSQGLTLIQGANGSGKSTLCDVIPWIVFGKTAKGGAVDDVIMWPGDEATTGTLDINGIVITRIRSPRAKENDLYFINENNETIRGKDLNDTQRLINTKLGMDYALFLSGAYIHEFSSTMAFFMSTPKNRRAICEQLVDLSLIKNLQLALSEDRKQAKRLLDTAQTNLVKLDTKIEMMQTTYNRCLRSLANFDADKEASIASLLVKFEAYETNKARSLQDLETAAAQYTEKLRVLNVNNTPCPSCGTSKNDTAVAIMCEKIERAHHEIKKLESSENPYLAPMERENKRVNTYDAERVTLEKELLLCGKQRDAALIEESAFRQSIGDLDLLDETLAGLRGALITRTVKDLRDATNAFLVKHFDAEIQVEFTAEDDIGVSITKDGNNCSYGQLSKGQRQLLKLCFAISAMRQVANHQGLSFPQIFFDEAFDGLDDNMKVRAFGLLQALELEYESIFIVEHSEALKPLFTNQYKVELLNGTSNITKT